jgi:transketolase
MALMDTLNAQLHAPGTTREVDEILRAVVPGDGLHYVWVVGQTNTHSFPVGPRLHVVRRGGTGPGPIVIALGPVLDAVLDATEGTDASVLYASTIRPFDAAGLRAALGSSAIAEVVLVEPWLAGTSSRVVADALIDVPHRLLALGVGRAEHRHYGTPAEHIAAHGLDAAGLRASIDAFTAARAR